MRWQWYSTSPPQRGKPSNPTKVKIATSLTANKQNTRSAQLERRHNREQQHQQSSSFFKEKDTLAFPSFFFWRVSLFVGTYKRFSGLVLLVRGKRNIRCCCGCCVKKDSDFGEVLSTIASILVGNQLRYCSHQLFIPRQDHHQQQHPHWQTRHWQTRH